MKSFWDRIWNDEKFESYREYIKFDKEYPFLDFFKKYKVKNVCDAACGFGKFSVLCAKAGYKVSGFDIAENSITMTQDMMKDLGCKFNEYKTSCITKIEFEDGAFDGVVANSVLDHLRFDDAVLALKELNRITKTGGLVYFSFDGLEKEDSEIPHNLHSDGSFEYTEGERKGMIFKHYTHDDVKKLVKGYEVLMFREDKAGNRHIVTKSK